MPALTPPTLEHFCTLEVELAPIMDLGEGRFAQRRIVPITGGRVTGRVSGTVLPVGSDWQTVSADGLAEIDARYAFRTADGAVVEVVNQGLRHGPPDVMRQLASGVPTPAQEVLHGSIQRLGGKPHPVDGREETAADQLCGRAGCFSPHIGREIAEREIDFVPDSGDDGDPRSGHCAHERLLIERPQVLQTAATAADHEQIEMRTRSRLAEFMGQLQRVVHLSSRAFALDLGRKHHEASAPVPALENPDEILHCRPCRRRDESDGGGKLREGALASRIEQSVGGQTLLEPLKLLLEPTQSIVDRGTYQQLVVAARLIDAQFPEHDELGAIAQAARGATANDIAAKHDAADLALRVLKREIHVAT